MYKKVIYSEETDLEFCVSFCWTVQGNSNVTKKKKQRNKIVSHEKAKKDEGLDASLVKFSVFQMNNDRSPAH